MSLCDLLKTIRCLPSSFLTSWRYLGASANTVFNKIHGGLSEVFRIAVGVFHSYQIYQRSCVLVKNILDLGVPAQAPFGGFVACDICYGREFADTFLLLPQYRHKLTEFTT